MPIPLPAGYNSGDTIYCYFDSYDSNGASVTITGLAVTDIEIYKDGSTTQRTSDNGYTLLDTDGIDFDQLDGISGAGGDIGDSRAHRAGPDHYEAFKHEADSALYVWMGEETLSALAPLGSIAWASRPGCWLATSPRAAEGHPSSSDGS